LWDLKLSPGGLVDVEFAAQFLQIVHAAEGGPLHTHTGEALAALGQAGAAPAGQISALLDAWRLQQDLSQVLKVAVADEADPADEPKAFRQLLARVGGVRDFRALQARLSRVRMGARAAFLAITGLA